MKHATEYSISEILKMPSELRNKMVIEKALHQTGEEAQRLKYAIEPTYSEPTPDRHSVYFEEAEIAYILEMLNARKKKLDTEIQGRVDQPYDYGPADAKFLRKRREEAKILSQCISQITDQSW